jgi:curved DNA-binding protein CbpA
MNHQQSTMSAQEAAALLNVSADADAEAMRAAYLQKVRDFPPDKDPEAFERIRDAYEILKDPRHLARAVLASADPSAPLADLLNGLTPIRRFAGHKLWLDALRERTKEARS